MKAADWYQQLNELSRANREAQAKQQAERLTCEFSQPLVQAYRRRRPRKRGQPTPLYDPQQKELY